MKETGRLEYSELPKSVDLETALRLNQRLWHSRDRFTQMSSPLEVPGKFTEDVFARVQDKYGSYIDKDHLRRPPLVGFSVFPEIPISWGAGYYYPDTGKLRNINIFKEFGTDWLARVVYDLDPYKGNCYLPKLISSSREKNPDSLDRLFAGGLLQTIKKRLIPRKQITEMFARILIGGDLKYIEQCILELSDGTRQSYGESIRKNRRKVAISKQVKVMEVSNPIEMAIAKPFIFSYLSIWQVYSGMWEGGLGQSAFPGVITLSGGAPLVRELVLAHEYIHSLAFHEDNWGGIPIKGYKLLGGVALKRNGKS